MLIKDKNENDARKIIYLILKDKAEVNKCFESFKKFNSTIIRIQNSIRDIQTVRKAKLQFLSTLFDKEKSRIISYYNSK